MVVPVAYVRLWPLGMAPVGPVDLAPPRRTGDGTRGREVVGEQAAEDERPPEAFGLGHVAGCGHELCEVRVRDGARVDQERADLHLAHGFAVVGIGEAI